MARDTPSNSALGVPGQVDGRATLQSDRGDETQALFMYQWAAGVVTLAGGLASVNDYVAIWCEHHDDLLAELPSGCFHAIQVKTDASQAATWKCTDSGFVDAIRKFAEHETTYSSRIERYVFFSNAKPYIPARTAKSLSKLASSPVRVRDECRKAANPTEIPAPYQVAFAALVSATGLSADLIHKVLCKLEFQKGPPLEGFRDHLALVVAGIPLTCSP